MISTMALPLSPAIDADVCDKDIFDSPADKQAAGFGDDDKDNSVIDDSSTVVGAINEEEEIDQDNYREIGITWENFPPAPNSPQWRENDLNRIPKVYCDKARGDMFGDAAAEIGVIEERLRTAQVRGDPKGIKKAIHIFLGPKSPIYHVHETIFPKEDYDHFARFMGGFYFASSLNMTYSQCYSEPRIVTDDFCTGKTYQSIWKSIDQQGLRSNGKRS